MGSCVTMPPTMPKPKITTNASKQMMATIAMEPIISAVTSSSSIDCNCFLDYTWSKQVLYIISHWARINNLRSLQLNQDIEFLLQQFTEMMIDRFDAITTNNIMKITKNGLIVSKTTSYNYYASYYSSMTQPTINEKCGFAFGAQIVGKHDIKEWTLKITETERCDIANVCIGICAVDEIAKLKINSKTNIRTNKIFNWYTLCFDGYLYHGYMRYKKYCNQLKLGDIIQIHLDMIHGILSFTLNDKYLDIAFHEINDSKRYRMYVSTYYKDQIEILE